MMIDRNKIYLGDCLEIMKDIDSGSVDMILCDLPYGKTRNDWDRGIPFESLWGHYNRIIKDNGAIVLTGMGVFSAKMIVSNEKMYRYTLIWEKGNATGFLNAKRMPLVAHEDIMVFYKSLPTYNPQKTQGEPYMKLRGKKGSSNYGKIVDISTQSIDGTRYPRSVISGIKSLTESNRNGHPTEKPVALFQYLIETYTNTGELVLDNCIGSGTTALACLKTGRDYIGIEIDPKYHGIAVERVGGYLRDRLPL